MIEIEPHFDPGLRAANLALSGRKRREVSRITSLELRFTDPRSEPWEALALILLLAAKTGHAQAPALHVWYRSAEGCPDGSQFLARLTKLGRPAQLASAGDPVDFVVTLGPTVGDATTSSVGRLERQTERGTVAIRELHAASCEDVAEALALSLDLALKPLAAEPDAATESAGATGRARGPSPERGPGEPVRPLVPAQPGSSSNQAAVGQQLRLGLQGTFATGVAPALLPGAALFAELSRNASPSARIAARAGYRESSAAGADLRLLLVTGRLEGCPWSWAGRGVSLGPCAALDLGELRADTPGTSGRSDRGLWFSGAAHLRASARLAPHWSLEAELGVLLPFVRYRFGSDVGAGQLFRTEALGLAGALGVAWGAP